MQENCWNCAENSSHLCWISNNYKIFDIHFNAFNYVHQLNQLLRLDRRLTDRPAVQSTAKWNCQTNKQKMCIECLNRTTWHISAIMMIIIRREEYRLRNVWLAFLLVLLSWKWLACRSAPFNSMTYGHN